ncbi:MAG: DUF4097 family beta strand repeat protein [Candidatus Eisenbacteria bacterium]|uniref:DUF4097 family beta strand repeat protein n=1 Tax=Eiseniibacteriota bacterium TaxID=2212470 RepID=A0A7Y2H3J7_UNCEI|nr:DUF4097 family beta strand repeat protein [Candidatus Eisenbacteria bacterium]
MRFPSRSLIGLGLLLATLSVPNPALGELIDREFHEEFDAEPGTELVLKHGDGEVEITSWNQDRIVIDVVYRAEVNRFGIGPKPDFDVEFRERGKRISVIGREGKSGVVIGFNVRNIKEHSFTIKAPPYVDLQIFGEDGSVEIKKWRGSIECELDDGDLYLSHIDSEMTEVRLDDGDLVLSDFRGPLVATLEDGDCEIDNLDSEKVRIRTDDGDIEIRDSSGNFDLRTEDGNIELDRVSAGDLEVESSDGNIELDMASGPRADWDLTTDDGRITLVVDRGTSAEFEIETEDGSIRLDLDSATNLDENEGFASGRLAGGEGRIRIRSADGTVVFRESS